MIRTSKIAYGGISFLLVVAIVFGVTANADDSVKTPSAVTAMCDQTNHKTHCARSLGTVENNPGSSSNDYIKAAIDSALNAVSSAVDFSGGIVKNVSQPNLKMAMEDCLDLLHFAVDELKESARSLEENKQLTWDELVAELKNWLSAVISYQDTCLDGLEDPKLKAEMSNGLLNSTQLSSNALAIVSKITGILSGFGFPTGSNQRKLDETQQQNSEQCPSWMPSKERSLLSSDNGDVKPNAVVAKDGSGQYKTINEALAAYPKKNKERYIIYVKAGIYKEQVLITKDQANVFMYGDGPKKTIVTGRLNKEEGTSTYRTATFAAVGPGFLCKSMGFENTAGPQGHQAVALRVQSDMSAFYNCRMDGYQDTLYTQTHRQFYRDCVISGTVDFIFGDASAIIQNSEIIVRMPMENQQNLVTASGRSDKNEDTGIVIQNCQIVPEKKLYPARFKYPTYLGRPWKQYARTVVMESTLGDLIKPEGWFPWDGDFALDTLYYAEYNNIGPGAATAKRVNWKGYRVIKDKNEVQQFTAGPFLKANTWLPATAVPFFAGFKA